MEDSYAAAKIGQEDVKEIMSHHRDILEQAIGSRQTSPNKNEARPMRKKISSWVEGEQRGARREENYGSIGRQMPKGEDRRQGRQRQGGYMKMYKQKSRKNLEPTEPVKSVKKSTEQEDMVKKLYFEKYAIKST